MRALILIIGAALAVAITASLTGCHNAGHYEYDMVTIEANFKACMNATPPPNNAIAFEHKIDACKEASWATTQESLVK